MAKQVTVKKKHKAVSAKKFKESFNETVPYYQKLSNGDEVNLDPNDKHTMNWIENNFIKEVK